MDGHSGQSKLPEGGGRDVAASKAQGSAYATGTSNSSDGGMGRRLAALGVASLFVLLAVMLLPSGLFQPSEEAMTLPRFLDRFMDNVRDFVAVFADSGAAGFYVGTACAYLAAFLAGGVLGMSGAVLQGSFHNPLASPSTLGVVSGCLMGAVVYLLLLHTDQLGGDVVSATQVLQELGQQGIVERFWLTYGRAICAVVGGCAVVVVALAVSRVMGNGALDNIILIVVGQVFALTVGSVCDTLRYFFEASGDYDRGELIQMAQAVPFDAFYGFGDLALFALPVALGAVVLLLLGPRLNLLSFSDEEAASMGVSIGRFRAGVVLLCTVLTGMVVAFCGPIVFVGFVCPHLARRVVGSNFAHLLPASLFTGAMFLCIVLFLEGQFDIDSYQGINLIASGAGCIAFLVIACRRKGGAYAWR